MSARPWLPCDSFAAQTCKRVISTNAVWDRRIAAAQGDFTISHVPSRSCLRKVSFQPVTSRLFWMPTFAVLSFFNCAKAARRRMLKLASAWP